MRRVFINKWFILASLLTISLSAFAFVAIRGTEKKACTMANECRKPATPAEKADFLWELISPQLPSVSFQ